MGGVVGAGALVQVVVEGADISSLYLRSQDIYGPAVDAELLLQWIISRTVVSK